MPRAMTEIPRRPLTSHPAFAPLIALWFAALLGLAVAVLPTPVLERLLSTTGLDALTPLTSGARLAACAGAGLIGALLGLAMALPLARRGAGDPRPIYADEEPFPELTEQPGRVRRPLSVREELEEDFGDVTPHEAPWPAEQPTPEVPAARTAEPDEGFMILTPQPAHPPRPAPDLDALLDQFDHALASFRAGEGERAAPAPARGRPDPVHAFVERQTGTPAPSPLGGHMPDHQAELRAALDKLAQAQRKD